MVYLEIRAEKICKKETTMTIVMFHVTDLNNGRDNNVCERNAQGLFLYHSYEMTPRELMGVE